MRESDTLNTSKPFVFTMFLKLFYSGVPVVPGLNPDETLVAEERLFPPIPSGGMIESSGTNANGSASANQQQGRGSQGPPMPNDE